MFALLIIVFSYHLLTEVLHKNITYCLSKQASRKGNENAFDYDHAQENPTCSDLGILPQGEQPMSALIEERLKRRSVSTQTRSRSDRKYLNRKERAARPGP